MESSKSITQTYKKYYSDRDYEQIDLFRLIKNKWKIKRAIYPGSYVHISPSFVIPDIVYIDSDKNAIKFFKDDEVKISFVKEKNTVMIQRFHSIG